MQSGWHIYRCQEYLTQNEEVQCDLCYVYQERSTIDRQGRGGADRLCTFGIDHPSPLPSGQHSAHIYKHRAICEPISIGGHESGTLLKWHPTPVAWNHGAQGPSWHTALVEP